MLKKNESKTLIITRNSDLVSFCNSISSSEFITIDTEFMRENTYYSQLCLIQIAGTNKNTDEVIAVCVDSLADDLDLSPVFKLLENQNIMKVFHAAFQDIEIFYNLTKKIPTPLCDTQIMAMVCGYKDSVSYKKLTEDITGIEISKSMQFTDWSQRPLSEKQLQYALTDVIPLREIYTHLKSKIDKNNRQEWVAEEMDKLIAPTHYDAEAEEVWKKIKLKSHNPRFLSRLKELAKWREETAKRKNRPRKRILKDEVLTAIAFISPNNEESLAKVRTMPKDKAKKYAKEIFSALEIANAVPDDQCPYLPKNNKNNDRNAEPLKTMLKMLLAVKCVENEVAESLIANSSDITKFAANSSTDIPALHGWRYEVFGKYAKMLKSGEISLAYDPENNKIEISNRK
ncbi:MAG: ribonuclease D [Alphaproteobacteria bacterium]|nr:ribonuclease D [Alphaproteobacteria bacterium]